MIYVVGSGPTGVAASQALLRQGLAVTMLDVGYELEEENQNAVKTMRAAPPTDWHGSHMRLITGRNDATHKGIPKKLVYGSDYPYRGVEEFIQTRAVDVDLSASLARGGLSNVWGSALAPYTARDIAIWPIKVEDLAPHYKAVLEWVPMSAWEDDLSELLPLYTDRFRPLRMSRQAMDLLHDLNTARTRLNPDGVHFGASRLAVRANSNEQSPGCAYCRLCLHGCPYELIYSSAYTLRDLVKQPGFTYRPGLFVQRVAEKDGAVEVRAVGVADRKPVTFQAERVYLAAGTLSSTKIVLDSLEAYGQPVRFLDSQYFLLPLIRFSRRPGVTHERMHTLAQLFLEIDDPKISANLVHLQIYSYNELMLKAMKNLFGSMWPLMKFPINQMVGRMMLCQGFIHSDVSRRIVATLQKPDEQGRTAMELRGEDGPFDTKAVVGKIVDKLRKHARAMGLYPAAKMLSIAQPGRSFHPGGSLPMSDHPRAFQTDVLGRPTGFSKVHVVDASVFPTIAGTTITLTAMANAHRIASAYHQT